MFFCALVQSEKNKIEQLDPNDFTYIDRAADIFFDEWNKSQPQLNKALTTLEWNTVKKIQGFLCQGLVFGINIRDLLESFLSLDPFFNFRGIMVGSLGLLVPTTSHQHPTIKANGGHCSSGCP